MSFNFNPKIVTDGLVVYLDAANQMSYISGSTTWNDISRNQITTTFTSSTTYNSNNLGSVVFNGTSDYAEVGPRTGFIMAPNEVTMLFWINGNYSGYTLGVVQRIPFSSSGLSTIIPNNGWVQVGYSGSGTVTTNNYFIINGNRYNANTAAHYQYDSAVIKTLFSSADVFLGGPSAVNFAFNLDPVPVGGSSTFVWKDSNNRLLGKSSTGAGFPSSWRYFSGGTASVMIYNRLLTPSEIQQNYNAMKSRYDL